MKLFSFHRSKLLFLMGGLFICGLYLNACSDFASIFNGGKGNPKTSAHKQGKKIASKKTRSGPGKVIKDYFSWPIRGEVSSGFGYRGSHFHDGIDIRAEKGDPVHASASGEVAFSGKFQGYGNLILIRHPNGYFTAYAHNSENLVKEGKQVNTGDTIAKVGDTGNASGYHLHFEIRDGTTPMDPLPFLP